MNLYFDVDEHFQETEQYTVMQCKDFIIRDFDNKDSVCGNYM